VALTTEDLGKRLGALFVGEDNVIELLEGIKPIRSSLDFPYVYLIDPADSFAASVSPSFDCVQIEQLPPLLAHDYKKLIIMCKLDRHKARIKIHELFGEVLPDKFP
jgi:hypothetical protein